MREIPDKERLQGRRKGGYEGQEMTKEMMQAIIHDTARQWTRGAFWTTCIKSLQSRLYECEQVTSDSTSVDENNVR